MTSIKFKRWAENSIRRIRGSPRSRTLPPQRARSVSASDGYGNRIHYKERFRGSLPPRAATCIYRLRDFKGK